MNTKVWYLPYLDVIETFSNANARMVHILCMNVYKCAPTSRFQA